MLAAPKKYSFGTRIYLDGLGIWVVEDRGWAIVPAWERGYSYDRIDVWMWYGEEWLRRAIYWGKRKVSGRVVSNTAKINLEYTIVPAPIWASNHLSKDKHSSPIVQNKELSIFDISLWKWSDSKSVTYLQEILLKLWYLDTQAYKIGEYDDATINAIYNLQIDTQILSSEQDIWAGSYGPKTRIELKFLYEEYLNEIEKKNIFLNEYSLLQSESTLQAAAEITSLWKISYGDINSEVRIFQKILTELGYFSYKDTAIFWIKTRNALIDYQIKNGIISDINELGSGIFWPQTKQHLIEKLAEIKVLEKITSKNLREQYRNYILWEDSIAEITIPENKISLTQNTWSI
jgi:hypothetical protein